VRHAFAVVLMLAITRTLGTRNAAGMPSKSSDHFDTLVVPPYLELVVFDIFLGRPGATVDIFAPGATTPVHAGTGGVESFRAGEVMATVVVPRPPPGEWVIRRSHHQARVRMLSEQFFPRGVLVAPKPGDALRQHDLVTLAYRIVDGSGEPLHELAGYELSADVVLIRPDGSTRAVATRREPGGFRSATGDACDLAGRYWTDVRITTADAHGRRLEVFRDRWSGFSVEPALSAGTGSDIVWPSLVATAAICGAVVAVLRMRRRTTKP
jgi:hypothetical protein